MGGASRSSTRTAKSLPKLPACPPPPWITDIPGSEAWALLQAALVSEPGCGYLIDCKPCVKAMHIGVVEATRDNRPIDRVHALCHAALEGVPPEDIIWIPSNVKEGGCGSVLRADGFLLTEQDRKANAAADILAKRSVELHRVPLLIRRQIAEHDQLAANNAIWIATVTTVANSETTEPCRDTEASKAKAAAAAAAKRKGILVSTPAQPSTHNPQTGKNCNTSHRPPHKGGHQIKPCKTGWWCNICRVKSDTWSRLAPQLCRGPAEHRWAQRAKEAASMPDSQGRRHHIVVTGPVTWCSACGAFGESAPKILLQACRGKRQGASHASGLAKQLSCLKRGIHPRTRMPLPPPVALREWKASRSPPPPLL